jgi:hypothetical protein
MSSARGIVFEAASGTPPNVPKSASQNSFLILTCQKIVEPRVSKRAKIKTFAEEDRSLRL